MADEDAAQPADLDAPVGAPESEPLPTVSDIALESYREYGDSGDSVTRQLPSQADSRNLRLVPGAPTDAPVSRVRDIAIVPTGTDDATADDYRDHPPVDGVDIGHGVSIERLSDEDYNLMMAACRPRGHFFNSQPQWGQRYSFVLDVQLHTYQQKPYGWDEEQILSSALALSRFVRDNVHCTEFAGRIIEHEDGEQQVVPLYGFDFRLAYRYGRTRDWLDAADAAELRTLLDRFRQVEPSWPPRVRRGIRNCDRASQLPYLSESQPRLVTAFEALINTSSGHVSKQFRTRVRALAVELGIEGVSGRLLDRMYDFRSKAHHGDDIPLLSGEPEKHSEIAEQHRRVVEEAALLQKVLRAAVRKTIEDDDFRAVFGDDDRIRQRWPVRVSEDGVEREI